MFGITWILALVQASSRVDRGWSQLVALDWVWLRKFGDDQLLPWEDTQSVSLALAISNTNSWSALLKRARCRCIGLERIIVDRGAFAKFQDEIFEAFGVRDTQASDQQWRCAHCSLTFNSFQAVRMHEASIYDSQHVAGLYLDGLSCRSCLNIFSTKSNLKRHLIACKRCLAICRMVYPQGFIPIDEVAKGLDIYRLTDLDMIRAQGPSVSSSFAFVDFAGLDIPEPPLGFV